MIYNKIVNKCNELNVELSQHLLFVSIIEEKLYHFENGSLKKIYDVSTSRNPPSCIENSNGTPVGLHKIDGKIGAKLPIMTVFRGRIPSGLVSEQTQEEQAIIHRLYNKACKQIG